VPKYERSRSLGIPTRQATVACVRAMATCLFRSVCMCSDFKAIHIGSPNIRLDPFQRHRCHPGALDTSSGAKVAATKSVDHSVSIEPSTSWSLLAAALAA
jgi:hypothetical protein